MLISTARGIGERLIPLLFIFTPQGSASMLRGECEISLFNRSEILLRLIRKTARDEPTEVASLVAKALMTKPLANPFDRGTFEFEFFERSYNDIMATDPQTVKQFRLNLMAPLTMAESYYLSAITQNQAIPRARKP